MTAASLKAQMAAKPKRTAARVSSRKHPERKAARRSRYWYSGKVPIKQKDDLVALVNDALLGGHLTTGQASQLTAMISAGAKPGLGAGSASNRPAQTHHTWMELGK